MRANRKMIAVVAGVVFGTGMAWASTWNQDVAVGAKWSDAGNWSVGVPTISDLALFNQTQANTYDVDVDVAGITRLLQVQQNHTFSGAGSIAVDVTPSSNLQNIMYNTTAGPVTYNVPVTFNTHSSGNYGQMNNYPGASTVFNGGFTLAAGTKLNAYRGTFEFNGGFSTGTGTLRLNDNTVATIGGSGTSSISSFIATSGAGSKLYLNRTGAYTVDGSGYLRVERSEVHFGADNAVGATPDVWTYGNLSGELFSDGNYDQNFGNLRNYGTSGATVFDMDNSSSTWTFEDSSGMTWNAGYDMVNVDTNNTIIRFALGGGGGLTSAQIGKITLNGTALTPGDTTNDGNYLYITQAIPEPTSLGLIVSISALGLFIHRRLRFLV